MPKKGEQYVCGIKVQTFPEVVCSCGYSATCSDMAVAEKAQEQHLVKVHDMHQKRNGNRD